MLLSDHKSKTPKYCIQFTLYIEKQQQILTFEQRGVFSIFALKEMTELIIKIAADTFSIQLFE